MCIRDRAHPIKRFEIRLGTGRHTVQGGLDSVISHETVKDLPIGSGCYKGLRCCWGANLCVTSPEVYVLCDEEGVEFVEVLWGISALGKEAFYGCRSLASVTLPQGLQEVGLYAFDGCWSLTSVTLPRALIPLADADPTLCECQYTYTATSDALANPSPGETK